MSSCQWFEKIYFFWFYSHVECWLVIHPPRRKKIIVGFWEDLLGQGSICFSDKETTSVLLGQLLPDISPGSELAD